MPAEAAALRAALAATWPAAETVRLGSWTLRRGAGGGSRVSAATLDGPLADPAEAEAAMLGWGQRPLFRIGPGEDALDALLAARGYTLLDPTLVLAAPVAALGVTAGTEAAIFGPAPLACMTEIWAAGGVGASRLAVMARAPEPRAYILGRLGDRPAGCGFVAMHGPVAMLHALEVAPAARRQGLGAQMTLGAAAWARTHGAATLALAVTRGNAAALGLYRRLGLAEADWYHYRVAPQG